MKIKRKSFGICYIKEMIYVIGGYNKTNRYLSSCECYNIL